MINTFTEIEYGSQAEVTVVRAWNSFPLWKCDIFYRICLIFKWTQSYMFVVIISWTLILGLNFAKGPCVIVLCVHPTPLYHT